MPAAVVIDGNSLTIDDVYAVAHGATVALAPAAAVRMRATRRIVDALVDRNEVAYGVTTGFGKLSEIAIARDRLAELQVNLVRSHAAGVGPLMPEHEVRALMLLRANVLAKGYSGARPELAELLVAMLNAYLYPAIPEQGSAGASGDLAPLAHLALAMIGEGSLARGDTAGAADAMLRRAGLAPATLRAKEGLTLINGTQAHTAVAANAKVSAHPQWDPADLRRGH
jgi:histidine ammonia-lyase